MLPEKRFIIYTCKHINVLLLPHKISIYLSDSLYFSFTFTPPLSLSVFIILRIFLYPSLYTISIIFTLFVLLQNHITDFSEGLSKLNGKYFFSLCVHSIMGATFLEYFGLPDWYIFGLIQSYRAPIDRKILYQKVIHDILWKESQFLMCFLSRKF